YGSRGLILAVLPDMTCKIAWTHPHFGTHFMTAIVNDGCLSGIDGHGPADAFLVCADLKAGKEFWRKQPQWEETITTPDGPAKLPTGTYRSWLMRADGHVLCLRGRG